MSYHVFTATRGGACAHMGEYPDHGAARAAWTLARPAGAIVTNAEGVALSTTSTTPPALRTALESFARSFFAAPASTPAAPPAATPKALRRASRKALSEGVVSPEVSTPPSPSLATLCADDEHPVGVGAATEAPLPVPFDAPVVAEDPSAEIERLRVQIADVTARAVAAEESLVASRDAGVCATLVAAEQTGKLHATTEALATIAKALRIPAGRDPEEIATRALASIKTYALDARVHGAEIERLREVIVELHEENKKLHARVKRSTRGTKPAPRVAETPVEQLWRRINELAAGVGR